MSAQPTYGKGKGRKDRKENVNGQKIYKKLSYRNGMGGSGGTDTKMKGKGSSTGASRTAAPSTSTEPSTTFAPSCSLQPTEMDIGVSVTT